MKRDQHSSEAADAIVNDVYAAANLASDDTPDPRVRATVLAAAARAVDARPRAAGRPVARRRWPLSAAALVVVSVLTGLVASQALRDDPDRVLTTAGIPATPPPPVDADRSKNAIEAPVANASPADSSNVLAAPRAVPTPMPTPAPRETRRSTLANATVAKPAAPASVVQVPGIAPSRAATADAAPTVPASMAQAAPIPAPPPAPGSSVPTTREKAIAPSAATSDRLAAVRADEQTASQTARQVNESSAAREEPHQPSAPRPLPHGRVGIEPVSPEAWVERIVALRALGDQAAADREIDALRRRYPDFTIPSRAFANAP